MSVSQGLCKSEGGSQPLSGNSSDSARTAKELKRCLVRSGIRYDYLMYDKNDEFFDELVQHHISGQLKVAPEHINAAVLDKMGNREKSCI